MSGLSRCGGGGNWGREREQLSLGRAFQPMELMGIIPPVFNVA